MGFAPAVDCFLCGLPPLLSETDPNYSQMWLAWPSCLSFEIRWLKLVRLVSCLQ